MAIYGLNMATNLNKDPYRLIAMAIAMAMVHSYGNGYGYAGLCCTIVVPIEVSGHIRPYI